MNNSAVSKVEEFKIPIQYYPESIKQFPTSVDQDQPNLIQAIEYSQANDKFIPVDEWVPQPEDMIFTTAKGIISLPIYELFKISDPKINRNNFNAFILSTKRSYNNPKMRAHMVHYLNYFEKFYDTDNELLVFYGRTKYLIEFHPTYNKEALFSDLVKYIMHGPISVKLGYMNKDNYSLHLTYKNKKNPALQYTDTHGMMLMKLSLIMNATIPILCHFMYARNVENTSDFLFEIYDKILHLYDVDIYNKLYETAISNVVRNKKRNKIIWDMQDIRGINETTHAIQCVYNIMLNIIPKYLYSENLVHFNYKWFTLKQIIMLVTFNRIALYVNFKKD